MSEENLNLNEQNEQLNNSDEEFVPRKKLTRKERKKKVQKERKREKAIQKARANSLRHNDSKKGSGSSNIFTSIRKEGIRNFRFTPLRIFILVVLAVIIFIGVMLFINRDMVSIDNLSNYVSYGIFNSKSEERFPITIQGTSISSGNFNRMGVYLCYTSDTAFSVYNNYGVEIYSNQISYNNPILKCCDEKCIVYSLGDKGFQINSKTGLVYEGESENNILVADVNNKGMYALVTEYDGYLGKLQVFDENNNQIYAYSFADYYITSVSINSNGERIMLSGVTALDGSEQSAVYVLDISKSEPIVFEQFTDNIIYMVSFLGDNHGCAVGNNMCCGFKISSKQFSVTEYEGKTLTAYTVNRTNNTFCVSVSRSGDGRNCNIMTFSSSGEKIGNNETTIPVSSLSAFKSSIAALSGSDVYLFDKGGKQWAKKDAGLDPHCVVLYTRNDAYILGVSDISRIDL